MKLNHLDEIVRLIRPLMVGFEAPWGIAGGWAIDLFLGRTTRPHADVELAIFRQDQNRLHQHLCDWTFQKVVDGRREVWRADERLSLPVHEIHARSTDEPSSAIEFLLNEQHADMWVFRRNAAIVLPLDRAILCVDSGLPILSPEIVLLYKAKSPRPRDELDFQSTYAALDESRRQWLRASLSVCHPGHPWLESLSTTINGDV